MSQEGDPWTEARVEARHSTWERSSLGKGRSASPYKTPGRQPLMSVNEWHGTTRLEGGRQNTEPAPAEKNSLVGNEMGGGGA